MLSKPFIYQLMHNRGTLKNIKIYIKTAPTCFGSFTLVFTTLLCNEPFWGCCVS